MTKSGTECNRGRSHSLTVSARRGSTEVSAMRHHDRSGFARLNDATEYDIVPILGVRRGTSGLRLCFSTTPSGSGVMLLANAAKGPMHAEVVCGQWVANVGRVRSRT